MLRCRALENSLIPIFSAECVLWFMQMLADSAMHIIPMCKLGGEKALARAPTGGHATHHRQYNRLYVEKKIRYGS